MPIDKLAVLKLKVRSILTTIDETPASKQTHVTTSMAEHFNSILEEIGSAFPEVKDSLPAPIRLGGTFERMGITQSALLDLRIYARQVLELLELAQGNS